MFIVVLFIVEKNEQWKNQFAEYEIWFYVYKNCIC